MQNLLNFKATVIEYFNNKNKSSFRSSDTNKSLECREKINLNLRQVEIALWVANINTTVTYAPPPAIGGLAGKVDLISNIFRINDMRVDPNLVIDLLNQGIGVLENEKYKAILRTIAKNCH